MSWFISLARQALGHDFGAVGRLAVSPPALPAWPVIRADERSSGIAVDGPEVELVIDFPEEGRLSPDVQPESPVSPNRKSPSARERVAPRRIMFGLLLLVALTAFAVGSIQQQWQRIYAYSSQICLSCMGLV